MVQEYIATAQPVGSTHIAKAPGVGVSSATVRNEMAVLEQEGYLVQPHTSAGRIPTDKGYRLLRRPLAGSPARSTPASRSGVGDFFDTAHGRLEEMLHQTSNLLAQLTHHASLVVGPAAEIAVVRSVQVVGLSARHATSWPCCPTARSRTSRSSSPDDISELRLAAVDAHLQALTWWGARQWLRMPVHRRCDVDASAPRPSTRCVGAGRRRAGVRRRHRGPWRRRSTRSTRCARCCTRSSSST
jgi:heat-inducible transcriptional repressor